MSSGADNDRWFWPAGTRSSDGHDLVIDNTIPGWEYTGLIVTTLAPGQQVSHDLGDREAVVIPLTGGCTVGIGGAEITLTGRSSVFDESTDVLYAPVGSVLTLTTTAPHESRIALALARVPGGRSAQARVAYLPRTEVSEEVRGAGSASRLVRNLAMPGVLAAEQIIACEVITPAGNWSSWPPHKHDAQRPGVESELEEIYYFEARAVDGRGVDPVGYQRVYGTSERPIDVLAEVRPGDVVLVPHGWHGPAMAAPDADLYYLNVMAGPGPERAWLICDDPAHGWVREAWPGQPVDPRLT